jgi:CRISPR system Cascade subunit CasD
MTDYHTAQSPPRGRGRSFATRREEVADKQNLGTILSYREYRSDCVFTIALWPRVPSLHFALEDIAEALRKPVFVPYAGRKACPLMLPMLPLIFDAANVREAFIQRDRTCESQKKFLQNYNLAAVPRMLALDADAGEEAGHRRERHRDEILDRSRWQFGMRDELVRSWDGGAE